MKQDKLKLIAITAMTIDHLTWTLFPGLNYTWFILLFHIIGRITAPIMWYFIVEGYNHTKNINKYLQRMFCFALISHFAYCFAFGISFIPKSIFNSTSVMWPLAWSILVLKLLNNNNYSKLTKRLIIIFGFIITFPSDWSCIPIFAILYMNEHKDNFNSQMKYMMFGTLMYSIVYVIFIDKIYGLIQLFTCLSIPLLKRYNHERGKLNLKYLFYIYYPLHLAIIGLIRIILHGNIPTIF